MGVALAAWAIAAATSITWGPSVATVTSRAACVKPPSTSFSPRPLSQGDGTARTAQDTAMQAEAAQPAPAARSGLFTINKLIHRVSGQSGPEEAPAPRSEPAAPRVDDDAADIPAFLRRQAN